MLLVSLILLELLLDIPFLLLLALLEVTDASLVIDVAKTSPREVPARLKVVVFLSLGFDTPKEGAEASLAATEGTP